MYSAGTLAVAVVRNQVVVVQVARTHAKRDKQIDVVTYSPFGEGIFIPSAVPSARVPSSSILSVLPIKAECLHDQDVIQLSTNVYTQYLQCAAKHQKRSESLWNNWVAKH